MIRKAVITLVVILWASSLYAACPGTPADCYTGTGPYTTIDCEQATITATIGAVSSGSMINVPAGECTWAAAVVIPDGKTIALIGGGSGTDGTVISSETTFIQTLGDNSRVSGFRLLRTAGGTANFVTAKGVGWRIDHNYMENTFADYALGANWAACVQATLANETVMPTGVVDNNSLIHCKVLAEGAAVFAKDTAYWATASTVGTANTVFFEDNTIDRGLGRSVLSDSNYGASYVLRYNNLVESNAMVHSVQGASRAGRNWEFYGNAWTYETDTQSALAFIRGGTGMMFMNTATGPRESYGIFLDNVRTFTNYSSPVGQCNGSSAWDGNTAGQNGWPCRDQIGRGVDSSLSSTDDMKSQASEPAYFWANLFGATIISPTISNGSDAWVAANRDYYTQGASFNGTSGVGCGTLASRPATCTTGVGYWATTQDCSDLTDYVGVDPATPISGTLYKCTNNNPSEPWEAYYTPYTYPHPLRGEGGATYFNLTVTQPTNGTIRNADNTLVCGSGGSVCSKSCDSTTSEVLSFTADSGYYMSAITGCSSSPCTLAMSEARAVTATFKNGRQATLSSDGTGGTFTVGTTGGTITLQ